MNRQMVQYASEYHRALARRNAARAAMTGLAELIAGVIGAIGLGSIVILIAIL